MKTIPDISQLLKPLEETIRKRFISEITGGSICDNNERKLISPSTRYDDLVIPIFHELVEIEFQNYCKITLDLTPLLINQDIQYQVHERSIEKIKENCHNRSLEELKLRMNEKEKRLIQIITKRGVAN